jgi:hypothetical protein
MPTIPDRCSSDSETFLGGSIEQDHASGQAHRMAKGASGYDLYEPKSASQLGISVSFLNTALGRTHRHRASSTWL